MKSIYTAVLIAIMGGGLLMMGCDPVPGDPPTPTDLAGEYIIDCYPNDPVGEYLTESDEVFTYTTTQYQSLWKTYGVDATEDPPVYGDCDTPLYQVETVQDFSIGVNIFNDAEEEVTEMDFTMVSSVLTVVDPTGVTAAVFNAMEICEISDWVTGTPRDITGKVCTNGLAPSVGGVGYEVLKLYSDTTPVTLRKSNGSTWNQTAGDRETVLTDGVYTKQ